MEEIKRSSINLLAQRPKRPEELKRPEKGTPTEVEVYKIKPRGLDLPIVINEINDKIGKIINKIAELQNKIEENKSRQKELLRQYQEAVKPLKEEAIELHSLMNNLGSEIVKGLGDFTEIFQRWKNMVIYVKKSLERVEERPDAETILEKVFEILQNIDEKLYTKVKRQVERFIEENTKVQEQLINKIKIFPLRERTSVFKIKAIWEEIKEIFKTIFTTIKSLYNSLVETINDIDEDINELLALVI